MPAIQSNNFNIRRFNDLPELDKAIATGNLTLAFSSLMQGNHPTIPPNPFYYSRLLSEMVGLLKNPPTRESLEILLIKIDNCSKILRKDDLLSNPEELKTLRVAVIKESFLKAFEDQNVETIQQSFRRGINPNDPFTDGSLPLHKALFLNSKALIQTLLELGADPLKTDSNQRNAFHYASLEAFKTHLLPLFDLSKNKRTFAEAILPNLQNERLSSYKPTHLFARGNMVNGLIEQLRKDLSSINAHEQEFGNTPLHETSFGTSNAAAFILIMHGAQNFPNFNDERPSGIVPYYFANLSLFPLHVICHMIQQDTPKDSILHATMKQQLLQSVQYFGV